MQIDRPFPHLVPGSERVVAQYKMMAIVLEFGIMLDARPSVRTGRRLRIIVSHNEVLAPVENGQQICTVSSLGRQEVAEMPNIVVIPDNVIPVPDERGIVLGHSREGTAVDPQDARISEMRIAREEEHPGYPKCRAAA